MKKPLKLIDWKLAEKLGEHNTPKVISTYVENGVVIKVCSPNAEEEIQWTKPRFRQQKNPDNFRSVD